MEEGIKGERGNNPFFSFIPFLFNIITQKYYAKFQNNFSNFTIKEQNFA
jgi:hypothetical protein